MPDLPMEAFNDVESPLLPGITNACGGISKCPLGAVDLDGQELPYYGLKGHRPSDEQGMATLY
jgi:hypothetical protein